MSRMNASQVLKSGLILHTWTDPGENNHEGSNKFPESQKRKTTLFIHVPLVLSYYFIMSGFGRGGWIETDQESFRDDTKLYIGDDTGSPDEFGRGMVSFPKTGTHYFYMHQKMCVNTEKKDTLKGIAG